MFVTLDCMVLYELRLSLSGSIISLPILWFLNFSSLELVSLLRSTWLSVVRVGCELRGIISIELSR